MQTISCVTTHCCSIVFSFITASCKVRGPLLTLRSEPQGFGVPTGRTPEGNQAPCLEGLETRAVCIPMYGCMSAGLSGSLMVVCGYRTFE
jgi:hypothetical protein